MLLGVVCAVGESDGAFGKAGGGLPWPRLAADLFYFRFVTCLPVMPYAKKTAVIMGRRTWESLPARSRPLESRINVVVSSSPETIVETADVLRASSLRHALARLESLPEPVGAAWVIGGTSLIVEALAAPETQVLLVTKVVGAFDCEIRLPELTRAPPGFQLKLVADRAAPTEGAPGFYREVWHRRRFGDDVDPVPVSVPAPDSGSVAAATGHEEEQYLRLARQLLHGGGQERVDRTGVGTVATFGHVMRFTLAGGVLPLLTTKRVFWRGVAEELLWFISGSTDARVLQGKGVHIWDGNSSRSFLDARGLTENPEGDLGPVYGFQWRHFGAAYAGFEADYTGAGVDQLKAVIHTLRSNPSDRRAVLSAWNPADLHKMALPPCHMFAQFWVANDGGVHCLMYQRSADVGLGVPFNIASYALLTRLVAQAAGLHAAELVYVTGDTHVYKSHVEALTMQVSRTPRPFPTLHIDPTVVDIDAFRMEHFTLTGYEPHGPLPAMPMAV